MFATDCDDPLCVVHRDDVDRFTGWPEPRPVAGPPVGQLGEWVVDLIAGPEGAVAVGADGQVAIWSGATGSGGSAVGGELRTVSRPVGIAALVACGPGGEIAVAAPGSLAVLGAAGDSAVPLALPGRPTAIAWHPTGAYVVAAYGRCLVRVNADRVEAARFDQLPSEVGCVLFDVHRHRIGAVIKKAVVWFDDTLQPGMVDAVLWGDGLRHAALSPGGDWLAIGCYGGTTLLWSIGGATANRSEAGPPGPGEIVTWSPYGDLLAVGHDRHIAVHHLGGDLEPGTEGAFGVPMVGIGLDFPSSPTSCLVEVPSRPSALRWGADGGGSERGLCLLAGYGTEVGEWLVVGGQLTPVPRRRWCFAERVSAVATMATDAGGGVLVGLADGALHIIA